MFGAAAASHVEAMHGASCFERGLGQAARVTRGAGSFQSMDQNQLCHRLALRRLRMHQHLDARLGVVEPGCNRKAPFVQMTMPVIARDGEQVRIAKEWDERPQQTILNGIAGGRKKERGRTRNHPLKSWTKTLSSGPDTLRAATT